eukprot:TRINITY_DN16570_c0_g1_i1.p1 TRINITY_DN16570_c0_g1~~TRINITY_DN16570_c0_g1_i1.p1  ORF type:complete len:502 (+),score=212.24 TRINITY_DN16570_c0_g1_i1:140-1507(+)
MANLQSRLCTKTDEEEKSGGIIDENDLYQIHETLTRLSKSLVPLLEGKNTGVEHPLLERFNQVMADLGEPKEPGSEDEDEDSKQKAKVSKLRNMLRKRGETKTSKENNEEDQSEENEPINYYPLVHLLSRNNLYICEAIWDVAGSVRGADINKMYVRLFDYEGNAIDALEKLIEKEVKNSLHESTLFRSNSIAPKYISEYSQYIGKDYLCSIIRPLINEIQNSPDSLEVDPNRLNGDEELAKSNCKKLIKACEHWFNSIAATVNQCPIEIRLACKFLNHFVGIKFPTSAYIAVGGLFFLRFVCPVIVAPERMQLVEGSVNRDQRRNLVLISKVLQNLSNDIEFGKKEPFMLPINEFISNYRSKMQNLQATLAEVPIKDDDKESGPSKSFDYEELQLVHQVCTEKYDDIVQLLTTFESENPPGDLDPPIIEAFKAVCLQLGPWVDPIKDDEDNNNN